jgi:hypothetical protein
MAREHLVVVLDVEDCDAEEVSTRYIRFLIKDALENRGYKVHEAISAALDKNGGGIPNQ